LPSFPTGVASKPANITDGLQILASHVGTAWDEIIAVESELLGAGTGTFFLDIRPLTAGSVVFQSRQITSDTQPRVQITSNGDLRWGSGTAATDLTLARSAARTLSLSGSEVINIQNAGDVGLLIKGFPSQTALLLDLQNSSSVSQFSVSPAGVVTAATVNVGTALTAPTLAPGTNTTGVATTAFVGTAVATATAGALPPGVVVPYAATSAPSGYLLCDGSSQLRASYANLFAVIGTTYGSADGTHFNVPDLRGRVVVGTGSGAGLSVRNLAATGGEENHILSVAELASHNHGGATGADTPTGSISSVAVSGTTGAGSAHNHGFSLTADMNAVTVAYNGGGSNNARLSIQGAGGPNVILDTWTGADLPVFGSINSESSHTHSFTSSTHSHTFTGTSQTHTISSNGSGTAHNNMQPYMVLTYIIKT
jgi:microcystin-dependent protein